MKRMLLVLAVALVMAALIAASAMPAFAKGPPGGFQGPPGPTDAVCLFVEGKVPDQPPACFRS